MDTWREVGIPEGLYAMKGGPIIWVAWINEKESWWI